ncbi:MAG TPA: phosphotransferase, partial [Patescibacteria group bacterium]
RESLLIFEEINSEINKFYEKRYTLTHGDLWPGNIYINNNNYYLIDFTDCSINKVEYDTYTLFYSILSSFKKIKINEVTIRNLFINNVPILKFLSITQEDLLYVEKKFIEYREKRFPGVYYS